MPDTHQSFTITRPGNRRVTTTTYGNPSAPPIFFFHGAPGSGSAWGGLPYFADRKDAFVLAPDRPGYARSDFNRGDLIGDWPGDVAAIADHLNLPSFSVCGISAGGPYALACAWKIPEKLVGTAVVSSLGPANRPGALRRASANRIVFQLATRSPFVLRTGLTAFAAFGRRAPDKLVSWLRFKLNPTDRKVLSSTQLQHALRQSFQEGLSQGVDGIFHDVMMAARWPLPLAEITAPIHLWHGEEDWSVGHMGHAIAAELPNCKSQFIRNAGHFWAFGNLDSIISTVLPRS